MEPIYSALFLFERREFQECTDKCTGMYNYLQKLTYDLRGDFTTDRREIYRQEGEISISFCHFKVEFND